MLYNAASCGDCLAMAQALNNGAKVNHKQRGGDMPLFAAARQGHWDAVRFLVLGPRDDKVGGANLDAVDDLGRTVLHVACQNANILEFLVQQHENAAAFVNVKSKFGRAPLMNASRLGQERVVALLLAAGANILVGDNDGGTCAAAAFQKGHFRLARKLQHTILWVEAYQQEQKSGRQDNNENDVDCDLNKHLKPPLSLRNKLDWQEVFVHARIPTLNETLWELVCCHAPLAPVSVMALVQQNADLLCDSLSPRWQDNNTIAEKALAAIRPATTTGTSKFHWHVHILPVLQKNCLNMNI